MKLQDELKPLLSNLSKTEMEEHLEKLTSFHTRYYKSDYGRQSSEWLLGQVQDAIKDAGADKYGVKAEHFKHSWGQNSIIATIPGKTNSTVVIGAHQDSINLWLPSVLAAPGADDDGSGTVTILEAFRVLLSSKDVIKGKAQNTIEFHWYSAEEGGLLGSQAIFSSYEKSKRDVKAMLQQDMTGFVKRTVDAGEVESVGVIVDFVDPKLTEFIKGVIVEVSSHLYVAITSRPKLTSIVVLLHSLRRDQVWLRLFRSRLRLQGWLSLRFRDRVCVRVLRQPHPLCRRLHQVFVFRSHAPARSDDAGICV